MSLSKCVLSKFGRQSNPEKEDGYTLIEVLITMFILGMIILVVNVVFIALIRVSYEVDVRMKVRQNLEFALEVIRRNTKSAKTDEIIVLHRNPNAACLSEDPPGWCGKYGEALQLKIAETSSYVTFFVEPDTETDVFVMKAMWQDTLGVPAYTSRITSDADINIDLFDIEVASISETGGTEIVINIKASSVQEESPSEPVVSDVFKQEVIITRHGQL